MPEKYRGKREADRTISAGLFSFSVLRFYPNQEIPRLI